MISSLTERGAEVTLRALKLGATDFVTKPKLRGGNGMKDSTEEIVAKIRTAARVCCRARCNRRRRH